MIKDAILKCVSKCDLSEEEAYGIFSEIMNGQVAEPLIASFLTALGMKGVCSSELTGAAKAMREHSVSVGTACTDAVDIVGTGGDGSSSFNVSTTAAFIAAGAGVTIAKHGNRASTSKCGAADVLQELGVNLDAPVDVVAECVDKIGIGFLFANKLHPAMKHAAPVRKALPFRTIFNLLGPITNPAGVRRHALGVYAEEIIGLYAETLAALGTEHALIFCGEGGLDELGLNGPSKVAELKGGVIARYEYDPKSLFGEYYPLSAIAGGEPPVNAALTLSVLKGVDKGAYRAAALQNAAAAIVAAGKASTLAEGVLLGAEAIDSGAAMAKLSALVSMTHA